MGIIMGPNVNIFVGFIEKQFFDQFDGARSELQR